LADRKNRPRKPVTRNPEETLACLIDAAEAEFNAHGFHGTDTNRIARRAGYAPQTFYRHFADKTAVFIAVYDRWWKDEMAALGRALERKSTEQSAQRAARIVMGFHVRWRGFRRSLRHLALEDPNVRAARIAARIAQMARLRAMPGDGRPQRSDAELVGSLLTIERLCDAAAEGELSDLGLSARAATALVARAMSELVGLA
jgi:AcrR family transcriptional regulator